MTAFDLFCQIMYTHKLDYKVIIFICKCRKGREYE